MAILGPFPPNLIFTIGILQPVKWARAAKAPRWHKTGRCSRNGGDMSRPTNRKRLFDAERERSQ
jgi:hypothetical protein